MSATGAAKFISDLVAVFPVHFGPTADEEDRKEHARKRTAWMQSMIAELARVDDEVLAEAASQIKRSRKDRRFPTIAECLDVCEVTKRGLEAGRRMATLDLKPISVNAWAPKHYALAESLLDTDQARRAADGGWILSFYCFVRDNGRAPSRAEEDDLIRAAREFDKAYADCVRGGFPLSRVLASLGDSMLARREELRVRASGRGN